MKSLVQHIEDYTKGRGWEWQECDCIGLLFHCVNQCAPNVQRRDDHLPPQLDYQSAVHWLGQRFASPVQPYMAMLSNAGILPSLQKGTASVCIVYGGSALAANDGEKYPTCPVPGVIFSTAEGDCYALMLSGIRQVRLHPQPTRSIVRYQLRGLV